MVSIQANLERVREAVGQAARRSGRDVRTITLVAVTKNVPAERILEALSCGVTEIGENRIQEAERKLPQLPEGIKRHLVGHLQTNKVKKALKLFDLIQSLDSLKLAEEINRQANGRVLPVLIEVNTFGELTKSGVSPQSALELLESLAGLKNIEVQGLMTIAPLTNDQTVIRKSFRDLKKLFDDAVKLNLPHCRMKYLSMGMSSDFEIAIEEGANLVRIGTAIFGARN